MDAELRVRSVNREIAKASAKESAMLDLQDVEQVPDAVPEQLLSEKAEARFEWTLIVAGIAALLSVVALIVAVVALASSGSKTTSAPAPVASTPAPASSQPAAPPPMTMTLSVKSDTEHAKRGPDGQWHDAFLPAGFVVKPGQKVTVTVHNYDSGPHTFTSPALGVNAIISGNGSMSAPQTVTFTFTAPTRPGRYQWWCATPCDPWAMSHNGYMRGFVTVKA
jgi:plastocyanin